MSELLMENTINSNSDISIVSIVCREAGSTGVTMEGEVLFTNLKISNYLISIVSNAARPGHERKKY